jgi:hypothetical protein
MEMIHVHVIKCVCTFGFFRYRLQIVEARRQKRRRAPDTRKTTRARKKTLTRKNKTPTRRQ